MGGACLGQGPGMSVVASRHADDGMRDEGYRAENGAELRELCDDLYLRANLPELFHRQ